MGVYKIINLIRTAIKGKIATTVTIKTVRWNFHLRFQYDFIIRRVVYKIVNYKGTIIKGVVATTVINKAVAGITIYDLSKT
jgi:hypothetical protein